VGLPALLPALMRAGVSGVMGFTSRGTPVGPGVASMAARAVGIRGGGRRRRRRRKLSAAQRDEALWIRTHIGRTAAANYIAKVVGV